MIDITQLKPEELERFIAMQATIDRQQAAATRVRALREYYAGDHPVLLTQRQQEYLGDLVAGDSFPFAHNLVSGVVNALAERLSVVGFSVNGATVSEGEGELTPESGLAALLWTWWQANHFDVQEDDVHTWALRDGAAYVMVDYDGVAGRPRLTVHGVDDGQAGIRVHRDPSDQNRILFATRYFWETDPLRPGQRSIERRTVYLPGEIRKYRRVGYGSWDRWQDDGDPVWPLPWVDAQGQPLGVAVIEFRNPGGSEAEQVIGLQNALNKSWLDLIAAADASGFPILAMEYPNGAPPSVDDANLTGSDELHFAPGRAIEIDGGTIKRIEAANLSPMLETIWALVAAIAGVTRTPQYYLRPVGGGEVPSGESLKQLESGLIARAAKRQNLFGQSWADVMRLAVRVEQAFGAGSIALPVGELSIQTQWQDAQSRNDLSMAQVAEAHKRLGVPDEQVWALLGYTPEQIAGFQQALRATRAVEVASIAAALRSGATRDGVAGSVAP